MIDSTSIPFINTMRHRVYGSSPSLATGSTFSSRQLRNCSSTGIPFCSNGSNVMTPLNLLRSTCAGDDSCSTRAYPGGEPRIRQSGATGRDSTRSNESAACCARRRMDVAPARAHVCMQGDEMTAVQPITRGGRVTVGGDLMVFSHLRWNWVWQRPQHIVSRLAERFDRTIFVEEPEAVPSAKRPQLRSEVCGRVERLWLEVPGPTGHCDFDDVRANDYGRMIAERFGTTPSIAWLYTPIALPLAEAMAPEVLVFDVMDDLAAFAHAAPQLRFANAL